MNKGWRPVIKYSFRARAHVSYGDLMNKGWRLLIQEVNSFLDELVSYGDLMNKGWRLGQLNPPGPNMAG